MISTTVTAAKTAVDIAVLSVTAFIVSTLSIFLI